MVKNIQFHLIFIGAVFACSFNSTLLTIQRSRTGIRQGSSFLKSATGKQPSVQSYSWRNRQPVAATSSRSFITWPQSYQNQENKEKNYNFLRLNKEQSGFGFFDIFGGNTKQQSSLPEEKENKRFFDEDYSNKRNIEGKTPLMVAIESSVLKDKDEQKRIIISLKQQGAHLFDPEALALAVKKRNLGALELIQPYYRLKDLYPEFQKTVEDYLAIKNKIAQLQDAPTLKKIYEDYLVTLKRVLEILNKPVQPLEIRVPVFKDGKEQEEFVSINNVTGLHQIVKDYSFNPLDQ